MFLIGFPLLLIPFAIYNIFAFIFGISDWNASLTSVTIISGGVWHVAWSDIIVALAILLLFIEIMKATRIGTRGIVDHMLSMVLFIAMIVEFLLVPQAATSTFFLLLVACFVDVLGGFTVSIRTAQRDVGIDTAERITS